MTTQWRPVPSDTLVLRGSLVPDRGIGSSLSCEGESQERGPDRDQSQWSASPSDAAPMSSCGFCISNPGIPRCDQVHCGRSVRWRNVEERFMLEPCGTSLNSPNGGHKCSNGRQTEANGTKGVLYLSSPTGSIECSPTGHGQYRTRKHKAVNPRTTGEERRGGGGGF